MAAYYTSQAYDAPASHVWSILTDFASWPRWFPGVSAIRFEGDGAPGHGTKLIATGDSPDVWTRWEIVDWKAPHRLLCEHIDSNSRMSEQVQAAYLQFELVDDPDGCTVEVEIGADGHGIVGDFFVGMTLGSEVRRMLPRIIDSFSDYVVARSAEPT
jgi:uncharacterized protein YndB with AHSA1/START domain